MDSFRCFSLFTSNISNKNIKIGIPTINPHTPKKCSENIKTMNVKKTGKSVLEDISLGFNIYASSA